MRYHLPSVLGGGGGGSLLMSAPEGSVHAQQHAGEPAHGGNEGEGEDGAPDSAPAAAPREAPYPRVPRPSAPSIPLSRRSAFFLFLSLSCHVKGERRGLFEIHRVQREARERGREGEVVGNIHLPRDQIRRST